VGAAVPPPTTFKSFNSVSSGFVNSHCNKAMFVAVLLGRGCRNISFFENVGWPVGAELPPPTTTKSFSSVGSRVDLEISTAIKRCLSRYCLDNSFVFGNLR
jgi:hypothetical protein